LSKSGGGTSGSFFSDVSSVSTVSSLDGIVGDSLVSVRSRNIFVSDGSALGWERDGGWDVRWRGRGEGGLLGGNSVPGGS